MLFFNYIALVIAGLFAGFMDSIVGGGGLITLPTLTTMLSNSTAAIATNKIIGLSGAVLSYYIYSRHQRTQHTHTQLPVGIFIIPLMLGSFMGSRVTPYLPSSFFRLLLILVCPVLLWLITHRASWITNRNDYTFNNAHRFRLGLIGFGAGFYDGFFGPGGGTLMLIGLLWGAQMPLLSALVLSKLANTISASTALVSYSLQGHVQWLPGIIAATGMLTGSYCGTHLAKHRAEHIMRPMLILVVSLLMISQVYYFF